MKYRLLATDIDGTLVNKERKISSKTKEMLARAIENGMTIVLSSGRPDCGIWPVARELELDKKGGYISAFNGAKVIDCKTGKVVISNPLNPEKLSVIYKAAREVNCPLLTHEGNLSISENPDDAYVIREAVTNNIKVKGVRRFEEYIDFPVYKFIATASPEKMPLVEQPIKEALADYFDAFRSNAFYLEIVGKGVNKGESLKKLAYLLQIPMEEVIACGDAANDIFMIEAAGLGVAVENAEEKVKEAADYITKSNEEEGIAFLLEKIMYWS